MQPCRKDTFYAAWKNNEDPMHEEYSILRTNIKGTTFGVPYGAGPERVSVSTGLTYEEASDLINRFFTKAHVLKNWLDKQRFGALRYGFSKSIKGRKRFYELSAEPLQWPWLDSQERQAARKLYTEVEAQIQR